MIRSLAQNNRLLSLVFVLSLGANVACLCFFAAIMLKNSHKSIEQQAEQRLESVLKLIPENSRPRVREEMQTNLDTVADNLKTIRTERRKIAGLLSAETVDDPAIRESFTRIRQLTSESQRIYQEAMVAAAAKLPQEDRRKMVDNLKKHRKIAMED